MIINIDERLTFTDIEAIACITNINIFFFFLHLDFSMTEKKVITSDELLDRIWFVYRYCINSVYVLCKDLLFFFQDWCEKIEMEIPKEA